MYLRSNRDMRIPRNYSGSAFSDRTSIPTPAKDMTRPRTHYAAPEALTEPHTSVPCESSEEHERPSPDKEAHDTTSGNCNECSGKTGSEHMRAPILSPFGELGSEELLLIALALIIFQNGKDPDLALILLALLFVS